MEKKLDVISIELKVTAVQMNSEIWMQGDLEITINSIKPYTENDIIDYDVLFKSLEANGEYFIFSCCCGVPDCGGWTNGIIVTHEENIVQWMEPNSNRTWNFDKSCIEDNLKNIIEEVKIFKLYFSEKQIEYVGFGYNL